GEAPHGSIPAARPSEERTGCRCRCRSIRSAAALKDRTPALSPPAPLQPRPWKAPPSLSLARHPARRPDHQPVARPPACGATSATKSFSARSFAVLIDFGAAAQRFRVDPVARALVERTFDVVFEDEGIERGSDRFRHRHRLDDVVAGGGKPLTFRTI